jgi:hypothetical protein
MPIGLKGNSDGSGAIQIGGSDAISISTGLNTTFAGTITATGTVAGTTGTLYPIVSGTAVSATGTAIDFTGIPSWVKRITVMFSGVSTNGTSIIETRLGTSGGIEATGYLGSTTRLSSSALSTGNSTTGFMINTDSAAYLYQGSLVIANVTANTWVCSGVVGVSGSTYSFLVGSSKALSGTLDRVRITTVNGTDTFDAGTINLLWE